MAKILVIDDAASVLAHIENVLSSAGHSIRTTQTVREGLAILANTEIDLILTDIYLPDDDGLHIIQQARRSWPETPIIAMSSKTGHWSMLRVAKVMGAKLTLAKPFTDRGLIEAVAQVCRG